MTYGERSSPKRKDHMTTTKVTPPLKWHGGKHYLSDWIISLMPPRCKNPNAPTPDDKGWLHYVEPYFGGGAVLLANDPEGISEVVNDKNEQLMNFWGVLSIQGLFEEMRRILECTPFSEQAWQWSENLSVMKQGQPKAAVRFFVRCRQSLAGRMKSFASITRNRTRRGMNEQVSAWLNAIEGLPAVHERLKRVLMLCDDALNVIRKEDGPRTLFYLDPPYLHDTRTSTGEYEHEMTADEHENLLRVLVEIKGRFLLSGYRSRLYDEFAADNGWNRHDKTIDNKAAGGKKKRQMTECVWTNYE